MTYVDEQVEKQLIGSKGTIVGDHPFAGETGEIVRVDGTPWGRRPVVRIDNMADHECFVMKSSEWRPHPKH